MQQTTQPTNKQTDKQTNKHATNFDNSADTLCCKTVLQRPQSIKKMKKPMTAEMNHDDRTNKNNKQ